jgi:hypothetical protein
MPLKLKLQKEFWVINGPNKGDIFGISICFMISNLIGWPLGLLTMFVDSVGHRVRKFFTTLLLFGEIGDRVLKFYDNHCRENDKHEW